MNFNFRKIVRRPNLASIEDIRASGVVSIWVGNFTDEEKLMAYVSPESGFEEHFGFRLGDADSPEVSVECELTSIRELLTGFSWWQGFIDEACAQADAQKITHANCAVVWHYINYRALGFTPSPDAQLHFLSVAHSHREDGAQPVTTVNVGGCAPPTQICNARQNKKSFP